MDKSVIYLICIISTLVFASFIAGCGPEPLEIDSFEECVAAGNPVMESYPAQCRHGDRTFTEEIDEPVKPPMPSMSFEEAREVAKKSLCLMDGRLKDDAFYNDNSKTWWIDIEPNKNRQGCNPACVVFEDGRAEINWRCTGLKE